MGVLFRTGQSTAASVSWPVYFFVIAPFQVMYGMLKLVLLFFKTLWLAAAAATSLARDTWRRRSA